MSGEVTCRASAVTAAILGLCAGAFVMPVHANAVEPVIVVAYSPATTAFGWGQGTTNDEALQIAVGQCIANGGTDCRGVAGSPQCVALVNADDGAWHPGTGGSPVVAESDAFNSLGQPGNIVVSGCATGPVKTFTPPPVDNRPTFCSSTGVTVPPGEECPKKQAAPDKPPTDAIRMVIANQGFSVKVTVTSTANIPGQCTYEATEVDGLGLPVNQTFDIAPKGTKDLTFPAPLPTQTYRVVVSCSGDFNGQNVEFGRQTQNV